MEKVCKNCQIQQPIDNFPAAYSKAGVKCYRGMCKACKNEAAKGYYKTIPDEVKKERWKKQDNDRNDYYFKNIEIRVFDDYELRLNIRWQKHLNRKDYFKSFNFDPKEVVSATYLKMIDDGYEYSRNKFYLFMWSYMAKVRYEWIKENPRAYRVHLEQAREAKGRYRRNVTNYYIKHLLSKKYSLDYLNANPHIIAQNKAEILRLRKNNNEPVDNGIPVTTDELLDLSLVNPEYKGYAITAQGQLYSCKALYRTDVKFTQNWYALAKRKNGCIRLSINGEKKELGIKRLLEEIYKLDIMSL